MIETEKIPRLIEFALKTREVYEEKRTRHDNLKYDLGQLTTKPYYKSLAEYAHDMDKISRTRKAVSQAHLDMSLAMQNMHAHADNLARALKVEAFQVLRFSYTLGTRSGILLVSRETGSGPTVVRFEHGVTDEILEEAYEEYYDRLNDY